MLVKMEKFLKRRRKKEMLIYSHFNQLHIFVSQNRIILKNYNKSYSTSKWSHLFLDGKTTHMMMMIIGHFKLFYLQLIDKTNFSLFLWSSKTFNLLCLLLFFCLIFLLFCGRAGVRYRSRFSPIKNQTRSTWYDRTHERTNEPSKCFAKCLVNHPTMLLRL